MKLFDLFLSPLTPFKKELKKYGFYDITPVVKDDPKYEGQNVLAMTNNVLVFVFSDRWHDQQIMIEMGIYPFTVDSLIETDKILLKYSLDGIHDYNSVTSYYSQSRNELVQKQITLLKDIVRESPPVESHRSFKC
jgi:hypothetical protein